MRFVSWRKNNEQGLALRRGSDLVKLDGLDLMSVIAAGKEGMEKAAALAQKGALLDPAGVEYLPVLPKPPKIVCVGMNYQDHADENKLKKQDFPTFFARFTSTLVGHGQPILRPFISDTLDFEGEMAVIIGKPGRHIPAAKALDHVAGYSVFNEASIRGYQMGKGQQWTLGKNFDNTGAFGPEFVSADEVPPGGKGLHLETRLNGKVVQSATTDDLIFDVATLISCLTEAVRLEAGDVIVSGTPAGIGFFREPKLYMKPGDICEVEIEGIGLLRNPIADEPR
jgi:2-keto-4-pentenoate hydratase/2-oxohepta-3-ene-1,7-dioic acid hydratase in catechol pathway